MIRILTILLFGLYTVVNAQEYTHNQFNFNYGRGLLMGHLARINHLPQKPSNQFELTYTKYSSKQPNFGIGINYINSGNPDVIGNIKGVFGFTDLVLRKKDSLLKFKIGFGLGHIEKIYDPNFNNKNIAIGSHFNANVIFKVEKNFLINQHRFYLGGGLTHFSNGSFQTPNLGLNFLSINAGYSFYSPKSNIKPIKLVVNNYTRKFNYGVAYRLGMRENFEPFRVRYPIHTLSLYTIYSKNNKRNYIGGLDFFYNPSVQFYYEGISSIRIGGYVGKEWILNQLILGIDIGFYGFDQYKDNGISYQRLNIHYLINDRIKATFLLKSHWTVAQAFQIGLAYELRK